jgi:hypothetical protein
VPVSKLIEVKYIPEAQILWAVREAIEIAVLRGTKEGALIIGEHGLAKLLGCEVLDHASVSSVQSVSMSM